MDKRKQDRSQGSPQASSKPFGGILIAFAIAALLVVAYYAGRHYFAPVGGRTAALSSTTNSADIGGPFSLVDQDGKPVTEADYKGRYMLVYFGFTYCPDVCPTSLARNVHALDLLGPAGDKVLPIMISIDPERDTPEHLKEYVRLFSPRMAGLTGTPEQVAAAAKVYRIYYAKVPDPKDPGHYTMDHTSITYLMGPDGRFVQHFRHDLAPDEMAAQLRAILG